MFAKNHSLSKSGVPKTYFLCIKYYTLVVYMPGRDSFDK